MMNVGCGKDGVYKRLPMDLAINPCEELGNRKADDKTAALRRGTADVTSLANAVTQTPIADNENFLE
jgi:hypothetical protein